MSTLYLWFSLFFPIFHKSMPPYVSLSGITYTCTTKSCSITMVIIMGFYTASHDKFHDRGNPDILYGINRVDIMGCCTPGHSVTAITW